MCMLVNVEESMAELRLSVWSAAAICKARCLKRVMPCSTLNLWASPVLPDHHPDTSWATVLLP
jgi:hypothetical protein